MPNGDSNPINSLLEGIPKAALFTWYAFSNGLRKLFTPSDWNAREQARRDIPKIPGVTAYVLKNGFKNFAEFVDIRDRGNDGPRR